MGRGKHPQQILIAAPEHRAFQRLRQFQIGVRHQQGFQQRNQILCFQCMQQSAPARSDEWNVGRFQRALVNLQVRAFAYQRHHIARTGGSFAILVAHCPPAQHFIMQHARKFCRFLVHGFFF